MGVSQGNFVKYPRTPHLFGSKGTADDKHLNEKQSEAFLREPSLIVEEKLDGTNVGLHFEDGQLILQCRGHLITEGMHPQYDLFKQWTVAKRGVLQDCLGDQYILYGEWLYARHTIHYRALTHYLYEFDIYDKLAQQFLTLEKRLAILSGSGIQTVPIVHTGVLKRKELAGLIAESQFDSRFEHPDNAVPDALMEGLYLRTESEEAVTGRAKYVRPEFTEKIKQSTHWQTQELVPNVLAEQADIWS